MKLKWALSVLGGALLVLSVLLAWRTSAAIDDARNDAGRRLETARAAAAAEFVRLVEEAAAALRTWDPSQPVPAPFKGISTGSGDEEPDDHVAGHPVAFTGAGALDVFADAAPAAPERPAVRRRGRIPAEVVRRRLTDAAGVGPPAARDAAAGSYTHLALVDHRGVVLLLVAAPDPDEETAGRREAERLGDDFALQRIRRGEPGELEAGDPPSYRGGDDRRMLGVWGRGGVGGGRIRVLVEVPETTALGAAAGMRLPPQWTGFPEVLRVGGWHVALAGALLAIFAAFFLWVCGRYAEIGVLVRVYGFARPYAAGIAFTVLVAALFSVATAAKVLLMRTLFDDVLVSRAPDAPARLVALALATAGIGVVMAITVYTKDYLQGVYSTAMMNDLRLAIGRRLVALPMEFHHRMRLGDLVARIERDTTGLRQLLNEVFETGFQQPFILVFSIVAAFVMNAQLAMVLLGMPLLVVPLFRIARKIKKRAEKRQVLVAEISHVQLQILTGIKVIKAFGGEGREGARLEEKSGQFMRETRRIQRLSSLTKALLDVAQMTGAAALVYFGGSNVLAGRVSVGDLMAFALVIPQIYNASKDLTKTFNKVIENTPAVVRVFEILDARDTLADGTRELPNEPLRDGIALVGARFGYLEQEVLHGVDLKFPAGQVVALVGPTGAGKTTVCDLVARFYDVTAGKVTYDGVDVREFTKASLVRSIAIVTQDPFLFNATVEENIRYGRPGATREEVEQAARDAFVHDEILAMEGGYRKVCGERGSALSGGQRQRVTIARALLKDAPVLILDEATSNLDARSEQMVQAALAKLMARRTVIVVAHRLSTIRNADKIVVLDGGRVVEEGAPSDLLADPGSRFAEMYRRQMGERSVEPGAED